MVKMELLDYVPLCNWKKAYLEEIAKRPDEKIYIKMKCEGCTGYEKECREYSYLISENI